MFGDLKVHVLFGDGSSKLELSKWLFLHFKIYPQIILHSSYWYLVWDLFVGWSNCVSPSMSSNICLNTNYILSSLLLNFSKQKLKHQMLKPLRILQSWQARFEPHNQFNTDCESQIRTHDQFNTVMKPFIILTKSTAKKPLNILIIILYLVVIYWNFQNLKLEHQIKFFKLY
jgi:hypothetical protein